METPTFSTKNQILNSLPADSLRRIAPSFELVDLELGEIIHHAGKEISHVYFPETSMISVIARTVDGQGAEVTVTGWEGMVGLDVILGSNISPHENLVQLAGAALRMTVEDVRREFKNDEEFNALLLHSTHRMIVQIGQTALCNRLHKLESRLTRWLLMCHDRSNTNILTLTHVFLSLMLGATRSSITRAAIDLQGEGLISYSRGSITILYRAGLEEMTCECYETMRLNEDLVSNS